MTSKARHHWHVLRNGSPGRRFEDYYKAVRHDRSRGSTIVRVVRLVIAAIAGIIGVILVFVPGPAILFFAIAGGLVAAESLWAARFLDWCEMRARKLANGARHRWRQLSVFKKLLVVIAFSAIAASSAYASYRVLFD